MRTRFTGRSQKKREDGTWAVYRSEELNKESFVTDNKVYVCFAKFQPWTSDPLVMRAL